MHLIKPDPYIRIVPRVLPAPDALVFWSGIAEIAIAGALLHPRTRRLAAWSAIGLFIAVFPANVTMALDARGGTLGWWLTRARLPLQPVLIWWAFRFTRSSAPNT